MKLKVIDTEINVIRNGNEDYISLTDMIRAKDGDYFITDWLRNRNTLEFLSVWEQLYNPNFNYGEFDTIKKQAGLNSFRISVKDWAEKTNATGILAKAGRYGGTYAHKDIAFEFGTWISPMFKLYLIREFQRLKEEEQKRLNQQWDYRRFLAKVNYRIHTDSIKDNLIPFSTISKEQEGVIYASEAELLNLALFGITSKEWRKENPNAVSEGWNMRDAADIPQLTVLANLESHNAELIRQGVSHMDRLSKLRDLAIIQLKSLRAIKYAYPIESPYIVPTRFSNFGEQ